MDTKEIRERFIAEREKRRMSVREVAQIAGKTTQAVYAFESGTNPRIDTLIAMVETLGYELTLKRKKKIQSPEL
jgi:transcriptional regulator with XRE-family HTH domain